jgi:4-hydroxy-tetrahydrodipicolinate reductase
MKIALIGYGKMGQMIEKIALSAGHTVVARITSSQHWDLDALQTADLCMEFTQPGSAMENIERLARLKKDIVIGTTGWYGEMRRLESLVKEHEIGALYSPNFSLGVQLFLAILNDASRTMNPFKEYDVAGMESHHNQKKDRPAGTALEMARIVEENMSRIHQCDFSSVRCGSMPGTYTIFFDSPEDTITLTHTARNREGYAKGAVRAAEWLIGKKGLYTFTDCIKEEVLCD